MQENIEEKSLYDDEYFNYLINDVAIYYVDEE